MKRTVIWAVLWLMMVLAGTTARGATEYVWLEGENAQVQGAKANVAGWGHKEFLSGEKWLHISVDADATRSVPTEGVRITQAFAAPSAGKYEVWNRIGFEFVRSAYEWRVDEGAWSTVKPTDLTTDCMELDTWCEVAWLKTGDVELGAGKHTFEIRIMAGKDAKGAPTRILFALDAVCLSKGPFQPYSLYKPGEAVRDAKLAEAAKQVFALPAAREAGGRSTVALNGLWEICRDDEQLPREVATPMSPPPVERAWTSIAVPGDKNVLRPDLLLAHRLWYRTRVNVPASEAGRGFFLVFPQNNLNTTVYVNGQLCGFDKNPFARVQIDVSKAVKAGVNEVVVGIRDAWYGYSTNPNDPMKLRKTFNLPVSYLGQGFQDFAYPVWNQAHSGILVTAELVAAGAVYASDVFCKPSVKDKKLRVEVTVKNPTGTEQRVVVEGAAIGAKGGAAECKLERVETVVAPGQEALLELAANWENPRLWWPDDPQLYDLVATVTVGGKAVDVSRTRFGFREWSWEGRDYRLNGVVWHGWADCFTAGDAQSWIAFYRKSNQQMMRFWGTNWMGMAPEKALDFFDQQGVVVRRSGILDGEAIGYMAIENDPDLKKQYNSTIKMQLMENWKDQMVAHVKGERNHPAVMIWSIENEWLYINCINLYAGQMDEFETAVWNVGKAVMGADPTRPVMNDGGGAHKNNEMPVAGDHYACGKPEQYPNFAYELNETGGGRGRWTWDVKRPRFHGEAIFLTGNHPEVSYFEGESAFAGKPLHGVAMWIRLLQEGYRWSNQNAWHYWMGNTDADGSQYTAFAPRAVLCRQHDWTFAAAAKVTRTLGIFNDTRYLDPMQFAWELKVDGKPVAQGAKEYAVPAGGDVRFEQEFAVPALARGQQRAEAELVLRLSVKGQEVFRDIKTLSILAPTMPAPGAALAAATLAVFDPKGEAAAFLKARGIAFTPVTDLGQIPASAKVLLVGRDALTAEEATATRLAVWAAGDRRVIVLEQAEPLRGLGLPAEMAPAQNSGYTAFPENATHPVLAGLGTRDFFAWAGESAVYRNAYAKPGRGATSLVQCHDTLRNTAVAEIPADKGLIVVCQLTVGEHLAAHPAAQQLLLNMLAYAAGYKQEFRPVVAVVGSDAPLAKALDETGLRYTKAAGALEAIRGKGAEIAVVAASPENLHALAGDLPAVEAFTKAGGSLVLCGLTPEGLADYNRIVGVEHLIRKGARERVTLPALRDPLTAGLTNSDVVLYSSKRIFPFTEGNYVVSDMFSYVVDFEDVAPFATSSFGAYGNIVNGFVGADGWPLIIDFPIGKDGYSEVPIHLPRPETITEYTHIASTNYNPTGRVVLMFDGQDKVELKLEENNSPQTFALNPPRTAQDILMQVYPGNVRPEKAGNIGIDNISIKAQRSAAFYAAVRPMLNIGGLMHYPRGKGHIVLCNLRFQANEEVPENAVKKRGILAAVLRNLKAPFAAGALVLPGMDLDYQVVDLSKQATQYRDEKGWFGDKKFTFAEMPTGRQQLGGVPYEIYEFPTSPVPTVLMLDGPGVPNKCPQRIVGVPVNAKADALFFLQAARIDTPLTPREVQDKKKVELCRYVVHYADGQTVDVPVYLGLHVASYKQSDPKALLGATLAWSRRWEGTDQKAAAYAMSWSNPRPEVAIASVDLVGAADHRGVPALLALTAARRK